MAAEHAEDSLVEVVVVDVQAVARDVIRIDVAPKAGSFPSWSPGAHVDVLMPENVIRQYSLTGSAQSQDRWTLGVLVEREGRGGSRWLAANAVPGADLTLSVPRNHFPFSPVGGAKRKVFIAGGIGITPLLPMVQAADAAGVDWELHYIGRAREHMAFLDELAAYDPQRVHLHPRDVSERPDLEAILLDGRPLDVYCCGPERLMDAVVALEHSHDGVVAHIEHFEPRAIGVDDALDEFDVVFEYTGVEGRVGPGQTILDVATAYGIEVPTSCTEGTCGSCETPIISGTVAHRDSVLTEAERHASTSLMVCVSRASCPRLVLDL